MRRALLALLTTACGELAGERTSAAAITGGSADSGDLAALGLVAQTPLCGAEATTAELFCSGVLIAPRVVLTAAHCTSLHPLAGSRVYAGTAVATDPGQRLTVAAVRRHPSWTADDPRANDIALLVLEEPAPFAPIPPIAMPLDGSFVGTTVRVVGFGKDDAGAVGTKRHGTATVTALGATTFQIAAAPAMSCEGDSGGPILVERGGQTRVAGVTSFGDAACRVGTNTRVDAYLTSFITPVLAEVAAAPGSRASITPELDTCAAACAGDADCPRGMTCLAQENAPNACALTGLPPGRFGASCDPDGCPGGNCVDTGAAGCLCYEFCDAEPPGGGCATGHGTGWPATAALALLTLRRRGRRWFAIALLVLAGACGSRGARGDCPEGTVSRGAAPPHGTVQFCERDGVRSGPFVEWHTSASPARKKREGHYKHGKLDGKWVSFFPDGTLEREDTYVDGVLEGRSVEYHPSGAKKEEGMLERGTRVGTWIELHENGKPRKQTVYSDGSLTQRWTLYSEDGVKTHEGMFANGRKEGLFTEYFPDGKPSVQGTWAASKKHGTWTTWDQSGNVVATEEYLEGELVRQEPLDGAVR